jgi:1,4-dihydroxy-2-naphthoate octaprenyltransferase
VSTSPSLKSWIQAARPKTLGAAWVPVIAATALSYSIAQTWHLWVLICALVSSLMIQIATNLFNDSIDFKKGADTAKRLGPMRVSASGLISPSRVSRVAFAFCVLAFVFALPLVLKGGGVILLLAFISLFFAYGYTGGPFPLAYLGLGDLFVLLFFGFASVLGTFYLQTGAKDVPTAAIVLSIQIGLWATALIAINNFRDWQEDLSNRKMTLSARFGPLFSRIEISFLLIFPFVLGLVFWSQNRSTFAAYLPLIALPLAVKVVICVWRWEPSTRFNALLAQTGAVHLITGVCLSIGLWMSSPAQ